MLLSLRFRAFPASAWPLGALLLVAGAPARAQSGSASPPTPAATPIPVPVPVAVGPQLTVETRPTSAIAGTHRPAVTRAREGRSLLMAAPAETLAAPAALPLDAPVLPPSGAARPVTGVPTGSVRGVTPSSHALSGAAAPQTLISPAKRVKVTSKTRFDASHVATQSPESSAANSNPLNLTELAATTASEAASAPSMAPSIRAAQPLTSAPAVSPLPVSPAPSVAPVAPVAPASSTATSSPRDRMSRPASRGGLMSQRAPVELQPGPPDAGAISDSQRRLLASLDADLGRAQRRLDRAETSLSEGQRQLGAFTGVLQTAMLDAGPDARGLHPFVRVAQRYMGTPYVWGGESARGFDCSGLIIRVMRDLGYHALPHSAAEQFGYGMPIARALLKPGDLVFFANTYKPGVSHVGIYLGRGRFINAANSKVGTIISNLDDPKWVEHYAGARRLLPVKS